MATLSTDFIKVAQAGPAFDGRSIREEWLRDMAATYNRAVYTAMLWPDHMRWYGNLGEVAEAKAEPDENGVLSLYVRLVPNKRLLEWNAEGQGLFYSIEVEEDFPGTPGKTYLGGLGVTDSPASLGLVSARFSKRENGTAPQCFSNVTLDVSAFQPKPASPPASESEEAPGWFKRHFPQFFTTNPGEEAPAEQEEPNMDELKAQIEALAEALANLTEQVTDLVSRVSTLEIDVAAGGGTEAESGTPEYKALAKHIGNFRKDMADMKTMFSKAVEGTKTPNTTAPAGGKKLI